MESVSSNEAAGNKGNNSLAVWPTVLGTGHPTIERELMSDPSAWVLESDKHDTEKHKTERAEQGFSTYDWWNFFDYISWVNINALEKFKTGAGYPGNLSGMDEWSDLLDQMIDGFKAAIEIGNMEYYDPDDNREENDARAAAVVARKDKGLALYAKYFTSLWD